MTALTGILAHARIGHRITALTRIAFSSHRVDGFFPLLDSIGLPVVPLTGLFKAGISHGITEEQINDRIANMEFTRLGETVTICNITLDNGYPCRPARCRSRYWSSPHWQEASGSSCRARWLPVSSVSEWPATGCLQARGRNDHHGMPPGVPGAVSPALPRSLPRDRGCL